MELIMNKYRRQIKECCDAINSSQLPQKQITWYKKLKKQAIKKLEFYKNQ